MIIKDKGYSIDLDSYKGLVDREITGKLLVDTHEQVYDILPFGLVNELNLPKIIFI
ncbi:hypothetical protein ES705_23629 [subsurface metagenome]